MSEPDPPVAPSGAGHGKENLVVGRPPFAGLPESLPEHWIDQIRDAVKADNKPALSLLLGSAVLAALIGAGASMATAYLSIKANADLEIEKSTLEAWQANQKAALQSYGALEARLDDLSSRYSGLASFIQIERKSLADPAVARNIRGQLDQLGVTIGTVIALQPDHNIDARLWTDIDKPIVEIRDGIVRSESRLEAFPIDADKVNADLRTAIEKTESAASELKPKPPGGLGR